MSTSPLPHRRPKRWPWVAGGLVALLVLVYFVVTSGPFIRGVVLPRAGAAVGSELTASHVALSPFSSLQLEGVKLTPKGAETLLAVGSMRVRYSLMDLIGGRVAVDEVTLIDPVVTVVERADGTSNLGRLLDSLPASASTEAKPPGAPPQLSVANVRLTGGVLSLTRPAAGGGTETVSVRELEVALDRLANGGSGRLTVGAVAGMDAGTNRLAARLGGEIQLGLTPTAAPDKVSGALQFDVASASGAWEQLAGLGARLGIDVTATEVNPVRLEFTQQGNALGQVTIRGTYDVAKTEAQLNYEVGGVDRRVLALAGAALGIDLRETTVDARGRLVATQGGAVIGSSGTVTLGRLSVDLGQGPTPELGVETEYKVTLDQPRKSVLIETLRLEAREGGNVLLAGNLDRPMNLAWDQAAPGFRESTLSLKLSGLRLAEWRAVLGGAVPDGRLGADIMVRAEQDGRRLQLTVDAQGDQLSAASGDESLRDAVIAVKTEVAVGDFKTVEVSRYSVEVTRGTTALVSVSGVADWHLAQQGGGAQFAVGGSVPALLSLVPAEGILATAGRITANGRATSAAGKMEVVATVGVEDFSGNVSGMEFADYDVSLQVNAGLEGDTARLSQLAVGLRSGLNPGGAIEASGSFELAALRGVVQFRVADLNEHALAPILAPALAPRRLTGVNLAVTGDAEIDLNAASKVRTQVRITRLSAAEPTGQGAIGPLDLALGLDAGAEGMRFDLGEVRVGLGKTERADNELTVRGRVDLSPTNAVPSTLEIRSTGLDLTPLYDLFAGGGEGAAPAPAAKPSAGPEAGGEPPAVQLPVRRLTADLDIARLYLREVEVSGWKARVELTDGRVALKPFALSLNGAPVTADIDANLGVPGYEYQVRFDAGSIPLTPLVNSFVPDRRGQIGGTAGARLQLGGAGITGANLERNLKGDFGVTATNLNLQLANVRTPVIKTVVNLVLGLPSLIRSASNPAAFLENLAGRLTGQAPGWVDAFSTSPLDSLQVTGKAGGGRIQLDEARVRSTAFVANAGGTVTLQPVLTNSPIAMPIQIALREDLARQVGVKAEAVGGYASLPDFVSLAGTLGQPKPDIDKTKLLLMGGQAALGLAGDSVGAAGAAVGNVLGAVKGLVDGSGGSTNAPASGNTNAPASAIGGLLKAIGGGGKPADTNAPAAPRANPLDILGIGRPKK